MVHAPGQLDSAEEKDDVQTPDGAPSPEPETAEDPAAEDPPASEPEDPAAEETPASEPEEPAREDPTANEPEEPAPEETPASEPEEPATEDRQEPKTKAPQKKARSKKPPPKKAPPKTTKQLLTGLLIKITVTAALVWALFAFVLGVSVHYGNNMYPAVHDGDLLVSLRMQKPFINAVVLYRVNGKTEVGRVIAVEGSVVDIAENGALTVNGVYPSEEVFYATYRAEGSSVSYPYTVGSGKVFILNDFRQDTNDSRTFGAVDKKDLKGPMLFTVRRRNF
ncbi:MAG: signal peptidase I [Clostridia bacterium]|nr:signal peptidase I [Clostridia bacterium]MBR0538557.1 signal peptidase I [Clostridia bacterium]